MDRKESIEFAPERQSSRDIKHTTRRQFLAAAAGSAAAWAAIPASAWAQEYPTKPIRVIVPFAPGGPSDVQARLLASRLQEELKQAVIVENKAGGAGNIGVSQAARSDADGYTLLFCSTGPLVINPALSEHMPFDLFKDFAPVALVSQAPTVLAVHPSVPATDVKAFVELVRTHPSKYSYASGGQGTTQHLSGAMLNSIAGLQLTHVPYKGEGPATVDALAGHVPAIFTSVGTGLQNFRTGKLRPLAVTSAQRNPALPEVPTMLEAGFTGFQLMAWQAVLAPAGTPEPVIERLNQAILALLQKPDVRQQMTAVGNVPGHGTPAEFGAFLRDEARRWKQLVQTAGLKPTAS